MFMQNENFVAMALKSMKKVPYSQVNDVTNDEAKRLLMATALEEDALTNRKEVTFDSGECEHDEKDNLYNCVVETDFVETDQIITDKEVILKATQTKENEWNDNENEKEHHNNFENQTEIDETKYETIIEDEKSFEEDENYEAWNNQGKNNYVDNDDVWSEKEDLKVNNDNEGLCCRKNDAELWNENGCDGKRGGSGTHRCV